MTKRIPQIEVLRVLAMAGVFFFHIWSVIPEVGTKTFLGPLFGDVLAQGYLGVVVFNAISGFVLTLPLAARGGGWGFRPAGSSAAASAASARNTIWPWPCGAPWPCLRPPRPERRPCGGGFSNTPCSCTPWTRPASTPSCRPCGGWGFWPSSIFSTRSCCGFFPGWGRGGRWSGSRCSASGGGASGVSGRPLPGRSLRALGLHGLFQPPGQAPGIRHGHVPGLLVGGPAQGPGPCPGRGGPARGQPFLVLAGAAVVAVAVTAAGKDGLPLPAAHFLICGPACWSWPRFFPCP
jgi:hypothetical protein